MIRVRDLAPNSVVGAASNLLVLTKDSFKAAFAVIAEGHFARLSIGT